MYACKGPGRCVCEEMKAIHPGSSRWGPPAPLRRSPGSPHPALGGESLPALAEIPLHDHEALAQWEKNTEQDREGDGHRDGIKVNLVQ